MLSFKEFLHEEYLDWNLILSESTDDINFDTKSDSSYGIHSSEHKHDFAIPYGNEGETLKGRVMINSFFHNDHTKHNIYFTSGSSYDQLKYNRNDPDSSEESHARQAFMSHVGKAVHKFVKDHILSNPEKTHIVHAQAADISSKAERIKGAAYSRFAKRLADQTGGKLKRYDYGAFDVIYKGKQ